MPRYDYTVFDNSQEPGSPICRPYLAVRLTNHDRHKNVVGLIDSGADISLAHADLATLLRIDIHAGRLWSYVGAVNGEIGRAYIHRLHLVVLNSVRWISISRSLKRFQQARFSWDSATFLRVFGCALIFHVDSLKSPNLPL